MTKAAILIDGAYFLKRLSRWMSHKDCKDPAKVANRFHDVTRAHLHALNKGARAQDPWSILYRVFYYDAHPYPGKAHRPVSGQPIDYAKTDTALFRQSLFAHLKRRPNTVLRLGQVRKERGWILNEAAQRKLLAGALDAGALDDDDFSAGLRQKAVDIRIGLDFATLAIKRQVDTIVLVSADADFLPAARLARREGVKVILDPLWRSVPDDVFDHIDGLHSGLPKPKGHPQHADHAAQSTLASGVDEPRPW